MELVNTLAANSMRYLDVISKEIGYSNGASILKSYYFAKSRSYMRKENFNLPNKDIKTTSRCPRCFISHFENLASYRLQPAEKKNRFLRRIFKKKNNGEALTNIQKKLLKRYTKKNKQYVIECGLCKTKVKKYLEKPKKTLETPDNLPSIRKNKKRKKSDRFSGLNEEAVLSINSTSTLLENTEKSDLTETSKVKKVMQNVTCRNSEPKNSKKKVSKMTAFQKSMLKNEEARKEKKKLKAEKSKRDAKSLKKIKKMNILLAAKEKVKSPAVSLKMFLKDIN